MIHSRSKSSGGPPVVGGIIIIGIVVTVISLFNSSGCSYPGSAASSTPVSTTGVNQARAQVETGHDGLTVEQRNIKDRIQLENLPGSIKHLYIISAFSGDVLIYSTVRGKVTSSGKRLSPYSVAATDGDYVSDDFSGMKVRIGGKTYRTSEVLQDDGTYGSSISYLFWFDSQGRYHQHYVAGGQIIHISDQPIRAAKVILNLEVQNEESND